MPGSDKQIESKGRVLLGNGPTGHGRCLMGLIACVR